MAKTLDAAGVKRLIQEIKGANKNLNTPIPISTENTPESKAQNVKNIADYVEKAKAAGIDITKSFRVPIICNDWMIEGVYTYNNNIVGVQVTDDPLAYCMVVSEDGYYYESTIVVKGDFDENQITSRMLDKGARKPIILTPSTTEVDEETYQKLLSDDVDVVFKTDSDNICTLTWKYEGDTSWDFYFTCLSCEANDLEGTFLYGWSVNIEKSAPHKVTIVSLAEDSLSTILAGGGFINQSTLSPVLQEIDLTGTDAERKAKLDQFETDWKALTGASDLTGARFVGKFVITEDIERNITGIMTYCAGDTATEANDNCFYGICNGYSMGEQKSQIAVKVSCTDGSLTITPLFSHLEAITIKSNNSIASKIANVAAIKAYVDNLTALGVDTTKGFLIPINVEGQGSGFISRLSGTDSYMGIMTSYGIPSFGIAVSVAGDYYSYRFQTDSDNSLTTESKQIVGAINEVNALAKGYSTIFTPIELTTETAQNKTAIDARVAAFTAQGISLTNGCCIPVTYKGVYAGNISLINGDWYGLLVKNTNNPADNINIKLSADGTITEGNSAQ